MPYSLENNIARITMDDGKVNVVGPTYIAELNEQLDQAAADGAGAIVISGRSGVFSAGFDLEEFAKGADAGRAMARGGVELAHRLFGLPTPVVMACTGHAIAMGAFLLFAGDTRIGIEGDYKFSLPETRINMVIPPPLMDLALSRLATAHHTRAVVQAEVYSPPGAVAAGFLDELVTADQLEARALEVAAMLAALPGKYYQRNKQALRGHTLETMAAQIPEYF